MMSVVFSCVCCCSFFLCCLFFFFKQKTAYEMRISDWSSDVCSSDLRRAFLACEERPASVKGRLNLRVALVGASVFEGPITRIADALVENLVDRKSVV